ncbi:CD99 antigen-like protein 2 isoform X4 [Mus musculus]|uniref:CD99 antigen-like protein 2 isoform X4 n=1 Tax=Mus musculus TaxID=10090 RepID=UPI0007EE0612|nr:CD99 antigen-like protein 2 isoform X4 [Mus musculus]|eukprot:XP_017173896.1 PREDICTED: CD99 antigen-like protein 2 isoform X4 [Mus musculus]
MVPKSQVQEKQEVGQTRILKTSWKVGDTNLTRIKYVQGRVINEGKKFIYLTVLGAGRRRLVATSGGGGYGSNDDPGSGISTETGTIAGVASALAMALIGAVSSYISYQQKKFCFSIQQGLNADYVKGENLEAVVCEEPQVTYSKQETQSAEPPPPEPPRI